MSNRVLNTINDVLYLCCRGGQISLRRFSGIYDCWYVLLISEQDPGVLSLHYNLSPMVTLAQSGI